MGRSPALTFGDNDHRLIDRGGGGRKDQALAGIGFSSQEILPGRHLRLRRRDLHAINAARHVGEFKRRKLGRDPGGDSAQ